MYFICTLSTNGGGGQGRGTEWGVQNGHTRVVLTFWIITDHQQPIPAHDFPSGCV